jgi:hypothetical protein
MILKEVSHIYQRPSGDVLIVVKNLYYLIDFPSFNVKSGYNGQSIENLGIPKGKRIDAIFRTYSGKTYIFYDKLLYIEFDECLFRSKEKWPYFRIICWNTSKYKQSIQI